MVLTARIASPFSVTLVVMLTVASGITPLAQLCAPLT
jgi:hypothetical protein